MRCVRGVWRGPAASPHPPRPAPHGGRGRSGEDLLPPRLRHSGKRASLTACACTAAHRARVADCELCCRRHRGCWRICRAPRARAHWGCSQPSGGWPTPACSWAPHVPILRAQSSSAAVLLHPCAACGSPCSPSAGAHTCIWLAGAAAQAAVPLGAEGGRDGAASCILSARHLESNSLRLTA